MIDRGFDLGSARGVDRGVDMDVDVVVDVVVIGLGVVGVAILERLARRAKGSRSRWIVLGLDQRPRVGGEVSARNSGVVHAGLHYPAGSLKTRLCLRGQALLETWCRARGVPFGRPGKLIVAQNEHEKGALERLLVHGRELGVPGLTLLDARATRARAEGLAAAASLFVPSTGIVDPSALVASLSTAAKDAGADIVTHAKVCGIDLCDGTDGTAGYAVHTTRGLIRTRMVVNAAGLYADEVGRLVGANVPRIHACRGDYFRWIGGAKPMLRHLVYPVPDASGRGLGVHLTFDLEGRMRFGPDAYDVDQKDDYGDPPAEKRAQFGACVRRLFPAVDDEDLAYDTCGIRPKLRSNTVTVRSTPTPTSASASRLESTSASASAFGEDFFVAEDPPGFVNLVGIESPGLTSALALAEYVEDRWFDPQGDI
ncbi:MAG: FAD-dependent oxidoreductase [Deltaproteobacteria bacterium]|nr:FAD-dependent oxidoreductase [Deltaproteobacteria bacterium]